MFDPPVKLGIPYIINLYTDPLEEKPTADTWVLTPMSKIVGGISTVHGKASTYSYGDA
jgi:hypothetical protein